MDPASPSEVAGRFLRAMTKAIAAPPAEAAGARNAIDPSHDAGTDPMIRETQPRVANEPTVGARSAPLTIIKDKLARTLLLI